MKDNIESLFFKFLIQEPTAESILEVIQPDFFNDLIYKNILYSLKAYFKKYGKQPKYETFKVFLQKGFEELGDTSTDSYSDVLDALDWLYEPLDDADYITDEIVKFVKRKAINQLMIKNAQGISDADDKVLDKLSKDINRISNTVAKRKSNPIFLMEDRKAKIERPTATPTCLEGLNKLTAAGGFYSPQNIIWLAPPKSFKTGLLLNLAIGFMKDGKNVYYADFENGKDSIRTRFFQSLLDKELGEVLKDLQSEHGCSDMDVEYARSKQLGWGEIVINDYPAYQATIHDVEADLDALAVERDFKPDVIIYDYLDLMGCSDKSIKEKRFQIQRNYHDVVSLNRKLNCFNMSVSTATSDSYDKGVLDMRNFGEDKAKAYNAHAAFAITQTEDLRPQNIFNVMPVVQREGVQFKGSNFFQVQVEFETQQMREIEVVITDD